MKTLLFISIEPSTTYNFSYGRNKEGELKKKFVKTLVSQYGFEKENLQYEYVYLSEAMNGQELYAEIISDDKESFDNLFTIINGAGIKWRHELEEFLIANFPNLEDADDFPDGVWLTKEDILAHVEK